MPSYHPAAIEPRWQHFWVSNKTFKVERDPAKPKYYILDMFPYPSGAGLHVGHPEGYTATDILARYKRMRGHCVLHPMGWDAFGLPAEQYAIETGTHPRQTTEKNIANFRRQIQMLGFSYDWDREVDTTDPTYYRWTQFIFLLLYDTWYDTVTRKGLPIASLPIPAEVSAEGEDAVRAYRDSKRLAYQSEVPVNWCSALGTVLANEEVVDGRSERGNHPVIRLPLRQWMLRITDYADRLIEDLLLVDWPESIRDMQRNWIGRSEGAEVDFTAIAPDGSESLVRVFTTRPDTLFGATYMVLSPEHPLVMLLTTEAQKLAVEAYREQASRKSDFERTEMAKVKTGVWTGAMARNPANGELVPVWIADYVLAGYGTGAIMAVPAHDERDFAFARQFDLPIKVVVEPSAAWLAKTKSSIDHLKSAYTEGGLAVNSGMLDGLETGDAKARMISWLMEMGTGSLKVNYKLRDWLFSRQRYWGEPFPLLHEIDAAGQPTGRIEPLDPSELPLELPELADFRPSGRPEPPLGKATEWNMVERDGRRYRRELNTMPQWAGSCWYYLRYLDPKNPHSLCDREAEQYWMPVDLYVGGAEHAVLHLLYSRFWHKVLFDRGYVSSPEPFARLVNQGMILGEMEYTKFQNGTDSLSAAKVVYDGKVAHDLAGAEVEALKIAEDTVEKKGDHFVLKSDHSMVVDARAFKMSKSRGNVINPDEVVSQYGADSLRLYEMFMGPLEATKPWSMRGVEGVYRFLTRVWRLVIDDRSEELQLGPQVTNEEPTREGMRMLHRTIQRVTDDLDAMRFNTAISAMMEYVNYLTPQINRPRAALEPFVLLLAPFAPHMAEELWHALGHADTLAYEPWPVFNPALLVAESIEVPVQVNGKIRARLTVSPSIDGPTLEKLALEDPRVLEHLGGKPPRKVVVVPGKLVNIVAG